MKEFYKFSQLNDGDKQIYLDVISLLQQPNINEILLASFLRKYNIEWKIVMENNKYAVEMGNFRVPETGFLGIINTTKNTIKDELNPTIVPEKKSDTSITLTLYPKQKQITNLSHTTFIIPFYLDSPDRIFNFKYVIRFLCDNIITNIIIKESGREPHGAEMLKYIDKKQCKIQYLFEETPISIIKKNQLFHRTRIINEMLYLVQTPVVCLYDIDVFFPIEAYSQAQYKILCEGYDLVYPFFKGKSQVKISNLSTLIDKTLNPFDNKQEIGEAVAGQCQFMNVESYRKAGMENENFIAYAPEDYERMERFEKLKYNVCWLNHYIYHIEHIRGINSSEKNPHYLTNLSLYKTINAFSYEELKTYYENQDYINKYNQKELKKVAILIIATNKYINFVPTLIESAQKYLLKNYYKKYFIFTDDINNPKLYDTAKISHCQTLYIDHYPFPFPTLFRFYYFQKYYDELKDFDQIIYVDADAVFVDDVNEEVLHSRCAVQHCGFYAERGEYETNPGSKFYVTDREGLNYFGGGFWSFSKIEFLRFITWATENLTIDLEKHIIPRWHDESILNRWLIDNPPDSILSPSYHYPQPPNEYFINRWKRYNVNFEPKIVMLNKNHKEIRK